MKRLLMLGFMVLGSPSAGLTLAQDPQAIMSRAVADFEDGRFADSAAAFDRLAKAVPEQAPYLWQRGIALYYAGRYTDCRRQFESHRLVNPADVENAAWHFLCVARAESPAKAREALGMKERALQEITLAAADRFAPYGGYMHTVARVHLRALTSR